MEKEELRKIAQTNYIPLITRHVKLIGDRLFLCDTDDCEYSKDARRILAAGLSDFLTDVFETMAGENPDIRQETGKSEGMNSPGYCI